MRKGHQAYDRLKEEKEELRKQKDREDRARRLINQRLKQKTDDFKSQEAATASPIKKQKEERQAAEDKSKMGLGQIRDIVLAWRDQTKRLVEESSLQWWSRWAKQAAEL